MSPEGGGGGLTEIFEINQEPALREPILVVALEGWVDAGLGATTAISTLLGQGHTEPIVTFNGEHFLDQRARRPVARIVNGITTDLSWPRTVVRHGSDESGATCSSWSDPNPTSTGGPSPTRWWVWPAPGACAWSSASEPSRRRRRTRGR